MKEIQEIIKENTKINPNFTDGPFVDWYNTPATTKGKIGEEVVKELLSVFYKVEDRVSREHDMVVDGKKVEVKTAFQKGNGDFVFYGYDPVEDPHYWLLLFVFNSELCLYKVDRNVMSNIYLGKTRKNVMFTSTPEDIEKAGGELIECYKEI